MIYVPSNSTSIYFNLALEYYLATEKKFDDKVFIVWHVTPTLVVGRNQNTLEEINKSYVDSKNINVARRLSGGGTVYQDLNGWQFAFIEPKTSDEIDFKHYLEPVIDAIATFGVKAEFSGRNDLVIDGRKFSGNSQYILKDTVVHHGTILFDSDIEEMMKATTVDEYKITSKGIKSIRSRVTNVKEHLTTPIDRDAFKDTIVDFLKGEDGTVYELTSVEIARVEEIAKDKFDSWEIVYGKNPKFDIERTTRTDGGKVQFKLNIQDGKIEQASMFGDFFSAYDSTYITEVLIGCKYEKSSIREVLVANDLEKAIYNVDLDTLVSAIAD